MADEDARRNGIKWGLALLLIVAVFGALFMLGFFTNIYKRGVPDNAVSPTTVNGNH